MEVKEMNKITFANKHEYNQFFAGIADGQVNSFAFKSFCHVKYLNAYMQGHKIGIENKNRGVLWNI